jgi:hypothetical protein
MNTRLVFSQRTMAQLGTVHSHDHATADGKGEETSQGAQSTDFNQK